MIFVFLQLIDFAKIAQIAPLIKIAELKYLIIKLKP